MDEINDVLSGKSRWAVVQGDCLEVLAKLPADSVNLCFGSPPYVSARLYLEDGQDLGIARGPEDWSRWMRQLYAGCLRVCPGLSAMVVEGSTADFSYDAAPALLMADMARAGVCLRKPPIYRRVGIPGSGGPDWLRNDWEWIICATRGGRLPWSDNTACGHPPKWAPGGEMSYRGADGKRKNAVGKVEKHSGRVRRVMTKDRPGTHSQESAFYRPPEKVNPGNVIDCKAGGGHLGSDLAHLNEAPFPLALAEFFVLSFCPPGGIVLDPFAGSGTTLEAAVKHGRRAIGIDLRPSQVALTTRRMSGVTPGLFGG